MTTDDSPFLSRWSRRKAQAREGLPVQTEALPLETLQPLPLPPTAPIEEQPANAPAVEAPPALTLNDVALLTRESDYAAFVARGVTPEVKNAALKKLFADPHFNIMDGLDTYIDDYNKADPLPEGMLRQMVQSKLLGLFDSDPPAADVEVATVTVAVPPALPHTEPLLHNPADEDTDLQLQPDDAAGRPGLDPGAGKDAGRQH